MPVFDRGLDEEVELKPALWDAEMMNYMGISARSKMAKEWGISILALLYPFFPNISLFLYKQRSVHFWVYEIQQNTQLWKQMPLHWCGMNSAGILRCRHKYVFTDVEWILQASSDADTNMSLFVAMNSRTALSPILNQPK